MDKSSAVASFVEKAFSADEPGVCSLGLFSDMSCSFDVVDHKII